jgi:hypothetical protein
MNEDLSGLWNSVNTKRNVFITKCNYLTDFGTIPGDSGDLEGALLEFKARHPVDGLIPESRPGT